MLINGKIDIRGGFVVFQIVIMAPRVLGALVTLGWVALPDATINTITTMIGALASVLLTVWARGRVTPVSKLKGDTASA